MARRKVSGPLLSIEVEGVRPTIVGVRAMVAEAEGRALAGALRVARDIQARARSNVASRRYDGRLDRAITVWAGVNPAGGVRVHVGIRGNTFAPEGKTFEVGWRSKSGLRPPVEPLAAWVMRRHLATSESKAKSLAFVISRKMGERGYSFGEIHWLSEAASDAIITAPATIQRYMLSGWASQPRDVGGRFMSVPEEL